MADLYRVAWMTAYTKRTLYGPAQSLEAAQSDLAFLTDRYAEIGQQYWLEAAPVAPPVTDEPGGSGSVGVAAGRG